MIYVIAITLTIFSHVIYSRGANGCRHSIRFEKIVVFSAAIAMMVAIFRLCEWLVGIVDQRSTESRDYTEHDMPGISGLIVYPLSLVAFVLLIVIALPKPIRKGKNFTEQDASSDR